MDHLKEITLKPFNSYIMTLLNVGFTHTSWMIDVQMHR